MKILLQSIDFDIVLHTKQFSKKNTNRYIGSKVKFKFFETNYICSGFG